MDKLVGIEAETAVVVFCGIFLIGLVNVTVGTEVKDDLKSMINKLTTVATANVDKASTAVGAITN
jgi:hypothetical protein